MLKKTEKFLLQIFATKEDIAYFRSRLSKLGDVFVNDAFGVAQRWHRFVGQNQNYSSFANSIESNNSNFLVFMI